MLSKDDNADILPSGTGSGELLPVIQACIAGDSKAQRQLYEQYAPRALGTIKRYLRDDKVAEEVLNDAFYKIFSKLGKYSFLGSLDGWIRRIVVNTIADHLRKNLKKEKRTVLKEEIIDQPIDVNIIADISYKELLKIISTLHPFQNAVFNLYVFEDYSHKEIAKTLKISEGYSRWYLNDARKVLKEKITAMN